MLDRFEDITKLNTEEATRRVLCKMVLLEISQNSQENICATVSFLIKLNDTEVAQNNSVFVWKTANCSCGRANLRNNMNQVKNLKSLDFTWKRIAKLLEVFPEVVLYDIHRLLCFL